MTEATVPVAQGGCLCGSVRYRINAPLREVILCHCGQCRRTHGHIAAYTSVEEKGLELVNDGGLKWYSSSESAQRGFCAECGASLFWRPKGEQRVSVAAGTLDPPTGLRTAGQVYCDDAGDYYEIDQQLPRCRGSLDSRMVDNGSA